MCKTFEDLRKENRVGIIEIEEHVYRDTDLYIVGEVFRLLIVVKAEYLFPYRKFVYHCYSPKFDTVPDGVIPPKYSPIITTKMNVDGTARIVDKIELVKENSYA